MYLTNIHGDNYNQVVRHAVNQNGGTNVIDENHIEFPCLVPCCALLLAGWQNVWPKRFIII